MPQMSFKNKLIRCMGPLDFDRIRPNCERIQAKTREVLLRRNDTIDDVCFPETGQASALAYVRGAGPIEVGTIGFEGMTDFSLGGRAYGETIVQVGGEFVRMRRTILLEAMQVSLPIRLLVLKWQQALTHNCHSRPYRMAL